MDLRKIKKLIELVEESGIAELEVKSGEEAVRISMNPVAALPIAHAPAAVASGSVARPSEAEAANDGSVGGQTASAGKPLVSPLSGTFYSAPSPDAAAFVSVGDPVSSGDVLCIVESMKMMNRIEADRAGVVTAVLATNGEPVESGQPLFLIDG